MKLALIDNQDSFTYILLQTLTQVGAEVEVVSQAMKSEIDLDDLWGIVISPGPGIPEEYHDYYSWLDIVPQAMPVLGVCLGMQILALWQGYRIYRQDEIVHGREGRLSFIHRNKYTQNLEPETTVGLYHSWAVDAGSADFFEPLATDERGTLMMMSRGQMLGVQFHPESFLTRQGRQVLTNWFSQNRL